MRDDRTYLEYVRQSIELVSRYAQAGEEEFHRDPRTQDAVRYRLETLADAASHLSEDLKGRHPDIPWRQITDFRNVLAHAYIDVRLDQVWDTVKHDLPALRTVVEYEISSLGPLILE